MPLSLTDVPAASYSPPETKGSDSLGPVLPEERIHALDLLRGWAMFGVLLSNLNDAYGTRDPATRLANVFANVQWYFVEERFFTLLCFLFGAGFAIQLLRAEERGVDVKATYTRRSIALLAIGLIHGLLIWNGDILTMYALVSFALVMFRTASAKRALVSALLIWILIPDIIVRLQIFAGMIYMIPRPNPTTTNWILAHGTWLQIAPLRVGAFFDWFSRWGLISYFNILAMFLFGMWAVKSGYLSRVTQDRKVTTRLLVFSILVALVGFAFNAFAPKLLPHRDNPPGITDGVFWVPVRSMFSWSTWGSTLAYAATLLLLWQTPRGARWLAPMAAAGRMALTTYLTQSVVSTMFFYGYGFGRYGHLGYTDMFVFTIVLFSIQMAVSKWWLARFRFGPAEWLWRRLTYGHPIPFRLQVQPA